jgi:uncharacterized protein YecE (DUF72 family)
MIKVGIGGWSYEPWRGLFFPEKLPKTKELHHASRRVTAIEVNGTFYSTFTPKTYKSWHGETPDDFVFALKAPRYAVNRRELGGAGDSIKRFFESGVSELGAKLGPILWQLAPTKKYDADDIAAFLALLPKTVDGLPLKHVLEVRHESFRSADFIAQVRAAGVALVLAQSADYPLIADLTSSIVYLRLQESQADIETGYALSNLKDWVAHARVWEKGGAPDQFPLTVPPGDALPARDVYVFFISGAKERNPAAAEAMLRVLVGEAP